MSPALAGGLFSTEPPGKPFFFLFLENIFIYLAVLGLCCCKGFSLVAASGGYPLVVVCGPLTVVPSRVVKHGL